MVIGSLKISLLVARFKQVVSPATGQGERSLRDEAFIAQVSNVVDLHIGDPLYTTRCAASDMTISRMHLNRRLRSLTGMSTHEFIRAKRLVTAYDLLQHSEDPVGTVAVRVGYRSASQFARAFRERYGKTPAQCRMISH